MCVSRWAGMLDPGWQILEPRYATSDSILQLIGGQTNLLHNKPTQTMTYPDDRPLGLLFLVSRYPNQG
jgi:hypothetical protein